MACGPRVASALAAALLLMSVTGIAPLGAQEPAKKAAHADVPTLLKTASEALDRKDLPAAAQALKSVVEAQPDNAPAWFNLGYAYSGLHQDAEAVAAYEKTLALQPNLFEAHLNLGILLMQMKRVKEAVAHLDKAVTLKPEHPRAHLYDGRALAALGQPEAAEKQFQEAIRLDPTLAIAWFDLGQLCLSRKDNAGALAAFQKAAGLDPKLPQAMLGAALALEGLNRAPEAIPQFEQYLAAQPDDLETRFHLAKLYVQQGKNEQALASLEIVYRAKPDLPGLAAALGDVCALLKKFPESEKYYRQALAATPSEPDLHRALGQTLLDQEKFPQAEGEFLASLKLDPRSREAAKGLATSLYLQKKYGEAVPVLEALARAPDAPVGIFFILATCYDDLHNIKMAYEYYTRFLDLSRGQSSDQEWQARQRAKLLQRELRK
ncbi:MAG: tetratricopeptide repeat protein [Acidobacteriia bacterium]|nr:tetratricopeptide repeat protein [Terriglobia bacterium]